MTETEARERPAEPAETRRIVVLAEDLIWATRLSSLLEASGAEVRKARGARDLDAAIAGADGLLVDLTARTYEPFQAIESAARAGLDVACVGQHEDVAVRKEALAAGAKRVWTYSQLHTHGPTVIGRWLNGE